MIVADTEVLIDFLADRGPAAGRVAVELESRSFGTTAVTRFELLAGAQDRTGESLLRRLLDPLPTLPLDRESADRAAEVRRALEGRGEGIGRGSLIAKSSGPTASSDAQPPPLRARRRAQLASSDPRAAPGARRLLLGAASGRLETSDSRQALSVNRHFLVHVGAEQASGAVIEDRGRRGG
jgi:predicted nucleic acid-binding protein